MQSKKYTKNEKQTKTLSTTTRPRKQSLTTTTRVESTDQKTKTCKVRYVSSKVGSMNNLKHKPGGGNVCISF